MKRRLAHRLTLAGHFGLMALATAWLTWLAPPTQFPISLGLVLLVGPLTLPMRGLLHGRPRSHFWAAMLSMLYLLHGLVMVISSPERLLGGLEVVLSLDVIVAGALYTRWSGGILPPRDAAA